jgi:short subunit dehydrogenase-like uncharacterized protein
MAMLDLIVFGATGYTGELVAARLQQAHAGGRKLRWGIAGRSAQKLAALRARVGAPADLPCFVADARDPAALRTLVRQSRAILTTAGPYQLHGEGLLRACIEAGTDYLDLCGEPAWMARMIHAHEAAARASGSRVVFSCGFDSVPFELGVRFVQQAAMHRYGHPLRQLQGLVVEMKGSLSGGTAASLLATVEAMGREPGVAQTMADPFALTPGFCGPPQPDDPAARHEPLALAWSAPFVMAAINTKNVHRTHALLGHPWGTDFVYEERQLWGSGLDGELRARGAARSLRLQSTALGFAPARAPIRRFVLPQPGQGPAALQRDRGRYTLRFIGSTLQGQTLAATVRGEGDPGYSSTSRIASECALALVMDTPRSRTPGGIWTPGAALGLELVPRLQQHAGLHFTLGR